MKGIVVFVTNAPSHLAGSTSFLSALIESEHLKGCSDFVSEFVALFDPLKTFFATPTPDQSNFLAEFDRSNNSSCLMYFD